MKDCLASSETLVLAPVLGAVWCRMKALTRSTCDALVSLSPDSPDVTEESSPESCNSQLR